MTITVTMPALSPTMTEGTLARWLVKEGDTVNSGDIIAEIETDKATMEVEAVDEGVVGKILVGEGTEGVAVNAPILVMLEDGEDASAAEAAASASPAPAAASAQPERPAAPAAPVAPTATTPAAAPAPSPAAPPAPAGTRIFASPLARRIAAQAGLDLTKITGSGPGGRIVKADVEAAQAGGTALAAAAPAPTPAAAPAPAAATPADVEAAPFEPEFELEKLSAMRKTIARRMVEAKQTVPHFYLTLDCELDALLSLRKDLNSRSGDDVKLSVNDLVIKAAALALKRVPEANASYAEAGIKYYKTADISVAVATDRGLITPVIRKAEQKGLKTISDEMRALAIKARDGKLMPEDYQGGSFSVSNLGMFGIKHFEAVINTPQACILAVGAGEKRAIVRDDALAIATMMSCTLSVDHRAVDGAIGARYLQAFKGLIEDPLQMML